LKIKQCIAARLLLSARSDDTDATSALEGATALDPTRSSRNVGISWRGPAAGVLESMPQHDKTSKEARGTVRLARNECHTLLLLHDKVRIILALLQAEARLTVAACPVGEFVPWGLCCEWNEDNLGCYIYVGGTTLCLLCWKRILLFLASTAIHARLEWDRT